MTGKTNEKATALTHAEQDQDAEQLKGLYSGLYEKIEMRITKQGFTPEHVELWIEKWYGWPEGNKYREMCVNAAKSIYRKYELEKAREALKNICSCKDSVRPGDDPNCPVHGDKK